MSSRPLPKPSSARTLQRKYNELAFFTHGRLDSSTDRGQKLSSLLHRYAAACANLYGVLSLQDLWDLLTQLEPELTGTKKLLRKDLFAFSDILRAEDLPYYILELDEIWTDTPPCKPAERLIVHKKLVGRGYYRFDDFFTLIGSQGSKPCSLPPREEFLAWAEPDHFRKSPYARDMLRFLEKLHVAKGSKNCDPDGHPIHGKPLNSFIFWSKDEQNAYQHSSRKWEKDAIAAQNNLVESEKLMQKIEHHIQLGDPCISMSVFFQEILDDLEEVGVRITKQQFEKLVDLFVDLNNKSRLWCNCGWAPESMVQTEKPSAPPTISFGPGLQQAIANGELDPGEIERYYRQQGFRVLH